VDPVGGVVCSGGGGGLPAQADRIYAVDGRVGMETEGT